LPPKLQNTKIHKKYNISELFLLGLWYFRVLLAGINLFRLDSTVKQSKYENLFLNLHHYDTIQLFIKQNRKIDFSERHQPYKISIEYYETTGQVPPHYHQKYKTNGRT